MSDGGFTDAGTSGSDGGCSDVRDIATCQNTGCQPQICSDCITCTSTFMGCTVKGAPNNCPTPPSCSTLCCGSDTTCLSADLTLLCFPPNGNRCGGTTCIPLPSPCLDDSNCLNHFVCQQESCCISMLNCTADCTDAGCPQGETCDNDPMHAHCAPQSCTVNAECPSDSFACDGGTCQRKTCMDDSWCSATLTSYCVNGSCYDAMGTCLISPP
jgi:hypothetical protein